MDEFTAFVTILQWVFRAGGVVVIGMGGFQFYSGTGEDGQGSDKRNGGLKVLGGAAIIAFGEILAANLEAPDLGTGS